MTVEYLTRIGQWLRTNGECIYGTEPSPFTTEPAWGYVTRRPGKPYLIVKECQSPIAIPALEESVAKAYLLADPKRTQQDLNKRATR